MKKPKCPHCGKIIARTIGVNVLADTIYYLNKQHCGYVCFPGQWRPAWHWKRSKDSRKAFQNFLCRYCGKPFLKKAEKEIFRYFKKDAIVRKLIEG